MTPILVLHGPNLNLLGQREPGIYGHQTLAELDARLRTWGLDLGLEVTSRQSNHEGQLIDWLHAAQAEGHAGVVLNPGGLAHVSWSLRDAVAGIALPVIEVHLSNVHAREPGRQALVTAAACRGVITGLGLASYRLGLAALADLLPGS
ncbi:MAG: type II 3-dehydroquinate dehydratase [Candidatus Sericytochromatia bacterium]|nr:type II 3-dehydroquinate dehydratase [Candidatus Sericytochromatia bacterium]